MLKKKAEEVFTPKGRTVNNEMFIKRHELEEALKKAIRKTKHIIIYGESGCGKTWLYKKVLNELKIEYQVLNSATIRSANSISNAIDLLLCNLLPRLKTHSEEKKTAELNSLIAKGTLESSNTYEVQKADPFLRLIEKMNDISKNNQTSFLIIENIEHIAKSQNTINELSSLILYLDDEMYSKYNVRLIIVGTSNDIRDYFSKSSENQSIINRIQEIQEVSILTKGQVLNLAKIGLFDLLGKSTSESEGFDKDVLLLAINWFSAGIPQYVHELGLELAINSESFDDDINENTYLRSVSNWVKESLITEYSRVQNNTNSVETRHGRRNQAMYAMSQLTTNEFPLAEVEKQIRHFFPSSTKNKKINVSHILGELSNGTNPILRKSPNGKFFRLISPKIKIVIRWMLIKGEDETISIRKFDESLKNNH